MISSRASYLVERTNLHSSGGIEIVILTATSQLGGLSSSADEHGAFSKVQPD